MKNEEVRDELHYGMKNKEVRDEVITMG